MPKSRKSWKRTVEDHAKLSARNHCSVAVCPYQKNPHRSVWIEAFAQASQLRLPL